MFALLSGRSDRDHRFCADRLSEYLDGALTARERRRLERHLADCSQCQHDLTTLRQTVSLLRRTPIRTLPRSFVLPVSLRSEQARHRRWAATYSTLRVAAAVASFLFIIAFSGDVLVRMGMLPLPERGRYGERSPDMVQPAAVEVRSEAVQESGATVAAQAVAAPQEPSGGGGELAAKTSPVFEPTPALAARSAATPCENCGVGGGPPAVAEARVEQPPAPAEAPQPIAEEQAVEVEKAVEKEVAQAQAEDAIGTAPAESPRVAMAPKRVEAQPATPTVQGTMGHPTLAATEGATAPAVVPEPTATLPPPPTASPSQPPPSPVQVAPTAVPTAALARASAPTPEVSADRGTGEEPVVSTSPLSTLWFMWRALRPVWGILAGLVLILLAGLLWVGQKRHL